MLQSQYYNRKLTENQIEKILKNYNIKYETMKLEINAKLESMIKSFVNDLRGVMREMEEMKNERKKIREAENAQMELEVLKSKLEEKSQNENKMKNEIDNLTKENLSLKTRIKIQTNISSSNKTKNKNINELSTTNSAILKSDSRPVKSRYLKISKDSGINKTKNKNNKFTIKKEGNKNKNNNRKNNHLSMSAEKRTIKNIDNLKYSSIKGKGIHNSSTEKRTTKDSKDINLDLKKIKNKNKKNYSTNKTPENKTMTVNTTGNVSSSNINNKNNKTIDNEKKYNINEIAPFDESIGDDDSLVTIDDVIEDELKELEKDEENIILLMEKIKNLNKEIDES